MNIINHYITNHQKLINGSRSILSLNEHRKYTHKKLVWMWQSFSKTSPYLISKMDSSKGTCFQMFILSSDFWFKDFLKCFFHNCSKKWPELFNNLFINQQKAKITTCTLPLFTIFIWRQNANFGNVFYVSEMIEHTLFRWKWAG